MRSRLPSVAVFAVLVAAGVTPSAQRGPARASGPEQGRCHARDCRSRIGGQVLGRVPTGPQPHELAVSTDGTIAFASNYGNAGHTISMNRPCGAEGAPPDRRLAAVEAARSGVREREAVFHGRSGPQDRPLRSGDREDRLAVRHRPGDDAHGLADERTRARSSRPTSDRTAYRRSSRARTAPGRRR